MPDLRGRLLANQPLAELTWFRVGGPAQVLFMPEDEADLAYFLAQLPAEIPVTVIGLGSNLIVRDGGVPGVVIRLGRGFNAVTVEPGAALARRHGRAGRQGRARRAGSRRSPVLRSIAAFPGAIGGALRMNGGAYGRRDQGRADRGARRRPRRAACTSVAMPTCTYTYRHCGAPDDVIFTQALFQGSPAIPPRSQPRWTRSRESREATQPIKSRTGGSTFKNPPGHKAWQLIDAAGCRGLRIGGAQVSEMHCNFLINLGGATAADIETLARRCAQRVQDNSGVVLEWEIKRIGARSQAILCPPEMTAVKARRG